MMDLVTTKVVAMSVLGCVSLVIGFAPLKLRYSMYIKLAFILPQTFELCAR